MYHSPAKILTARSVVGVHIYHGHTHALLIFQHVIKTLPLRIALRDKQFEYARNLLFLYKKLMPDVH